MPSEQEPNSAAALTLANDNHATAAPQPPAAAPGARERLHGTWELDPGRSSIEFSTRNLWGLQTVKGRFEKYHGKLHAGVASAIELTVEAATVQTGNRKRDKHLRSPDFFDVDNHPQVTFVSESVLPQGDTLKVRGVLSARGRSLPVELDAQLRPVDGGLQIRAATTIPHRELGMTWSPLGTIAGHTQLAVNAHLIPNVDDVAA